MTAPVAVERGQVWTNATTGASYPVQSVRGDVIQRGELLIRLGSGSSAILLSEDDLRARYVCTASGAPGG